MDLDITDVNHSGDVEAFDIGAYFVTREIAEQARDRLLETLKQFHKEHKIQ